MQQTVNFPIQQHHLHEPHRVAPTHMHVLQHVPTINLTELHKPVQAELHMIYHRADQVLMLMVCRLMYLALQRCLSPSLPIYVESGCFMQVRR